MPKYDNLADHYKAKWQGQLARCRGQAKEIQVLRQVVLDRNKTIDDWKSRCGNATQKVGSLRMKIKRLEEELLTSQLSSYSIPPS
jgi:hypothetical protein